MRLYVHTDLDGVMCAVLISCVEEVDEIKFLDPGTVQAGKIPFTKSDIIADLPFDKRCGMWFDHHASSRPKEGARIEGAWADAPSAARVVYDYYDNPYLEKYAAAVAETDKIDSGQVSEDDVKNPKGWFLLSNTFESNAQKREDDEFRRHAIEVIRKNPDIEAILEDGKIAERAKNVIYEFAIFKEIIRQNTRMMGKVAYSDLRLRPDLPKGNNYIVYSLFPDAITSVRLMPLKEEKEDVKLSVGHNIYRERKCEFDVGAAMKKLGGGGHRPVGGASVKKEDAEKIAMKLVDEINAFEAGKA